MVVTTALRAHPEALPKELMMNEAIDILSLLTDVILFIMPLPVSSRLSPDASKKRLLIGLFSWDSVGPAMSKIPGWSYGDPGSRVVRNLLRGLCIEVAIRVITTYGFNGALDAIQVQCLLMGIEPAHGHHALLAARFPSPGTSLVVYISTTADIYAHLHTTSSYAHDFPPHLPTCLFSDRALLFFFLLTRAS